MWISISAAAGKPMDIPIITQHLTSQVQQGLAGLSTKGLDLLLSLDTGNHPSHPTSTVDEYLATWWCGKKAPDSSQIVNSDAMEECLRHHKTQRKSARQAPACQSIPSPQGLPAITILPCSSVHCIEAWHLMH